MTPRVTDQKKLTLIFVFCCGILLFVFVTASIAQTDSVTLQQAISLAWQNNQVVSISEIEKQQNEIHLKEVQALRYPPFFIRSHYLYAPDNGYSDVVTNGGEYGFQLTTGIPLYDAGIRSTLTHQVSNAIERSSIVVQKSKIDLSFEVRSAYYEIVRARNELQIRRETKQRLDDYSAFLEQLHQGGSVNTNDVLKSRVELNNAIIEVDNATNTLAKDKMALNKLIGKPIKLDIEIAFASVGDTTSLPQFSVENTPDVLLLKREKISAEDDITLAKAERLPTVSVSGDVGWLGVTPSEYRQNFGYSIFLNLDFPIWSWGGIDTRIQQKELSNQIIDKQIELQRRDLELQWNTTITDIQYARNALGGYARNIVEAEKNYLLAKSRFAGGSGSNLEVLDAQRLLVEIKLDYNKTLMELNSSFTTALKLSGQ
ncbi:MAG: TolC family protein [Bacteroidota bacterium]